MSDLRTSLIEQDDDDDFVDPELALQSLIDDPNLVQLLSRTESEGLQTVVGYFRVAFQPGQQRTVLHVPFIPPLNRVPNVEAHATDRQDVRVRVTDIQKFGVRAEVIATGDGNANPNANEPERILIEIIAAER